MYPHVPAGINEKALAASCVEGDLAAGVKLVQLLWAKGKDGDIDDMLNVAFPLKDGERAGFTQDGFDNLADALTEATRQREFQRVMVAVGVQDVDPPDLGTQPESD